MTDSDTIREAYFRSSSAKSLTGDKGHATRMVAPGDPRDFEANRAMVRDELIAAGIPVVAAEAWCAAWEREATRLDIDRRVSDFWTLGSAWIREQMSERQGGN
jgi:hypothetical protein